MDPAVQQALSGETPISQALNEVVQSTPNQQYLLPGQHIYNTKLDQQQEGVFQQWLQQNNVPFDPSAEISDYDMRGFWRALMAGDEKAKTAVNPNDKRIHYPDFWKTPYHKSFSAESQWADPAKAPRWNDKDQLVLPDGTVVFDERKKEGEE